MQWQGPIDATAQTMTGARGILRGTPRLVADLLTSMTHIGRSVVFDGHLTCEEDVTIAGQLKGSVHVRNARLLVAQPGQVDGTIRAARITIHGTVHGPITASDRIELGPSARVTGDLSAISVTIADGAIFNGRVDMGRRTIAAKVAQYRSATR